jgi:hypothetical protein
MSRPSRLAEQALAIRQALRAGPCTGATLAQSLGVSQPTLSRALAAMGGEVLRMGAGASIHYAVRDEGRGLPEMAVFQVDAQGRAADLGRLCPARPQGWVFEAAASSLRGGRSSATYSEGLPWWMQDMLPQGYLGRAYAVQVAPALGLPASLSDWGETQALQALLRHGQDAPGHLLLGEAMRDAFVSAAEPLVVRLADRAVAYARMSEQAARGELPASSAGGEQPKFLAYAEDETAQARHVLVKFSVPEDHPVSRRWRDLLLAEHHALQTLRRAGVAAAASSVIDQGHQRFLEVERFDRVGPRGRHALYSLAALEAEFIGDATSPWPVLAGRLMQAGLITKEAADRACLLYAYGTLIGNTDMHHGNLSFMSDAGRPYALAPAYDMLPMGLAPRSGGGLPTDLPRAALRAAVPNGVWHQALSLALDWRANLDRDTRFSGDWPVCLRALDTHLNTMAEQVRRLAV